MNLNHKYFNQYEIFFKLFLIEIALKPQLILAS